MGILVEFEYLLNLWQNSKGYISLDQANESENVITPEERPQAQSNIIIAREKSQILVNTQPVVAVKTETDIKPLPNNLQGHQISPLAMVVAEPDVLLTVVDSDENSIASNTKRMRFDDDDGQRFVSYLNNTRNI